MSPGDPVNGASPQRDDFVCKFVHGIGESLDTSSHGVLGLIIRYHLTRAPPCQVKENNYWGQHHRDRNLMDYLRFFPQLRSGDFQYMIDADPRTYLRPSDVISVLPKWLGGYLPFPSSPSSCLSPFLLPVSAPSPFILCLFPSHE